MGKELSLARSQEERLSMLLASIRSGQFGEESASRDKRQEDATTSRTDKSRAAKGTTAKGKVSRKAKRTNASTSTSGRYRRGNKNRQSDRGDEGEDSKPGRSASELGIRWIGSYCPDGSPHYSIEYDKVEGGSVYRCIKCHKIKWLPVDFYEAIKLGTMMDKYKQQEGYCRYLNLHRSTKIMVAKLQDLERLSSKIDDKMEFARIADKILSEKDYDKKKVEHELETHRLEEPILD